MAGILASHQDIYSPSTKLGEGNIFTGVFQSLIHPHPHHAPPSLFHSTEIEVVSDTNMLYETSIPWNWVHWSPLNVITKEKAPSTVPLLTMWRLYLRLAAQCEQFVAGSNPSKHPVCTSGLWIKTFDPDFTPIWFSVKKQHQLLCCMFSTATPVHWIKDGKN